MVASLAPPTGDLTSNPGMCPRLGISLDPLIRRLALNYRATAARVQFHFSIAILLIKLTNLLRLMDKDIRVV